MKCPGCEYVFPQETLKEKEAEQRRALDSLTTSVTHLIWSIGVAIPVLALMILIYKFSTADSHVQYCFLQRENITMTHSNEGNRSPITVQTITLYGHREWRLDLTIGSFDTHDAGKAIAEKINCPLQ